LRDTASSKQEKQSFLQVSYGYWRMNEARRRGGEEECGLHGKFVFALLLLLLLLKASNSSCHQSIAIKVNEMLSPNRLHMNFK